MANVWDVASARAIEAAGFPFLATSSRAVAQVLGEPDDDTSDPDLIFSWTARIAQATSVPVTADVEAGLGVPASELVERLLEAGVVGCNLEDTAHHDGGLLVDAERQAAYLAEVRDASDAAGVHLVINARTDSFIHWPGGEEAQLAEAIRRGRLYLDAGADCVYPMFVRRQEDVASLLSAIPGPLNVLPRRGGLTIAQLSELGVHRISLASWVFQLVMQKLADVASALADGAGLDDL
ncbi:MAG: isocitrate lyase/phosphoenolpyruvate mutase family protein [Acidimicrobiaceae bacterium]|nr:isocitrate lyase/phosphoenolpyruvate mutase family protein [Acidimicrobiaceae bacterium]